MHPLGDQPDRPIAAHPLHTALIARSALGLMARRSYRVGVLGLAIMIMSAVDLYLTLLYVTHTGMNEMNPLARAMMEYQSPALLSVWKGGTVLLCVGILLMIRKQRSAEIGAWAGVLLLGWLMSYWMLFIHETREMNIEVMHEIAAGDSTFIMMDTPLRTRVGRVVID